MIRTARSSVLALLLASTAALAASAQQVEPASPNPLRPLRIAKWSTLAAAASAAVYGFVRNGQADDRFEALERLCQAEPARCALRTPDGAYQDDDFERRFGEIRSLDRRAHTALLLSQIGVGASVVLFLLDLGNAGRPSDIPFVPTALDVAPRSDGSLAFSLSLPFR